MGQRRESLLGVRAVAAVLCTLSTGDPVGSLRTLPRSRREMKEGQERGVLTEMSPLWGRPTPPELLHEDHEPSGQAERSAPSGGGGSSGRAPLPRTRSVFPDQPHTGRPPRESTPSQEAPTHPTVSAPPSTYDGTRVSEEKTQAGP